MILRVRNTPIQRPTAIALALLATAICCVGVPAPVGAEAIKTESDTMLSRPCKPTEKCLHNWTLTSRLGHILEIYEKALGRRNSAYRILGIEFTTGRRPRTWYPDFGGGHNSVVVQLTAAARNDRRLALFQLGHEAFHLIEPIKPGSRGSFLEEGLASYFAVAYLKSIGMPNGADFVSEKNYRRAYEMVVRLAKQQRDFYARLRRLRKLTRSFSRLTSDDIRAVFPEAPAAIARQLAEPFATAGRLR